MNNNSAPSNHNCTTTTWKVAKCQSLHYEDGRASLSQGHKGDEWDHWTKSGVKVIQRGYGWALEVLPSKLILTVKVGRQEHELWVHWFFKKNLGRLTKGRRDRLEATMPETIRVERVTGQKGTKYFRPAEDDMLAWLRASGL
jgi:hypothetical protein